MTTGAQPAPPLSREEALNAVRAGATLVTANDRLARVLRDAFHAQRRAEGARVWPSPRIHSWGVWVDRLWRELEYRSPEPLPLRLTAEQERLLWEQAIECDPGRSRLLELDATAEAARSAAKLAVEWRLEREEIEASESEDVQSFVRWRRHVEERLAAEGWIDGGRATDVLILRGREIGGGVLLLAGFDVMTPQQQELLEAFRAADGAVRDVGPSRRESRRRRRVQLDGRRDEIRAAARWAKALANSDADAKIGVVVPGLSARRQEVERIFREEFHQASLFLEGDAAAPGFLSIGLPLARYPLVHAALLGLDMQPDATELATFGAWLCCEAIAGGAAERNARGLLDRTLRDKGVPNVAPAKLGGLLNESPKLQSALQRWNRRWKRMPPRQTPAQWSATFSRLLEALGWPGEEAETSEGCQTLLKWNELLGTFAALGATAGEWDFPTARGVLTRMARATLFQPETADAQVEVMSLLESAGAEADHLWIAGLDNETWPDEARPNPFLPIGLQRERGLPHASAARELELARVQTSRLLESAPDVVVSHAKAGDDGPLEPSPLIAEIPLVAADSIVDASRGGLIETMRASARLERIQDAGLPFPGGITSAGGSKIFELQAHCPFRAFAALRLGAQSLREAAAGLSPGERGNLAHYALEHIWSEIEGSEDLRQRAEEDLRETITQAITHAFGRLAERRRAPLPRRFEAVERARLEDLLKRWLEIERTHRKQRFRVAAVEVKYTVAVQGLAADVRVDRVDELDDGRRVILDYKTGAANLTEWDHERPMQPQLPLYAVHHAESLAGVLFARLKTLETGFKGAVAPGVVIEGAEMNRADEFEDRLAHWRANLEGLAADFLAGRAEIDPRDGDCLYCDLPSLCRKDDIP